MGKITSEELKPVSDYFSLKAIIPYLSDEQTVKEYLETQKMDISPNEFLEYYLTVEKNAIELINRNPEARAYYLRLENPMSISSQIKNITSYGKKNLEKRFVDALRHTYDAVMKTGFDILHDNNIYVTTRSKNPLICVGQRQYLNSDEHTTIELTKKGKYLILDSYLGIEYDYNKKPTGKTEELFNDYWNSFTKKDNSAAGNQIKRIIQLEDDITLFLQNKQIKIKDLFG